MLIILGSPILFKTELVWKTVQSAVTKRAINILLPAWNPNDNSKPLIDPETCELYIIDSQINTKTYLDEFNTKCLDFKNLNK